MGASEPSAGWKLVGAVEQWIAMQYRFVKICTTVTAAMQSKDPAVRDDAAQRLRVFISELERALPSPTFDGDVEVAIERAIGDATDPALSARLQMLTSETRVAYSSLVRALVGGSHLIVR